MKKGILKVFGVAALAAGMLYNVQVFDTKSVSDISMAALGSIAIASSESGGSGINCNCTMLGSCKANGSSSRCASFSGNGDCWVYDGNC